MEGGQGDSIVLEEEIDPNYEPTEKEVIEYATWLGMDLDNEKDLFWIAREGLKAPLPENWKPCKTTDTEEIYYFNFASGQSTWDHPCDEFYRNLYEEHKKKRHTSGTQEVDERKRKEKEDVAELLGRGKGGKKKRGSLSKANALGDSGPAVSALPKTNSLEMKPLGKLGGLGPVLGGGGGGGLKPVGSLGRIKSGAKASSDELDDADSDGHTLDLPKSLSSKPPLGGLLSKKPLPSATSSASIARAESKADLDGKTAEFEAKKDSLLEQHAKTLREMETNHEDEIDALRKRQQAELDRLRDAEDDKMRQLKRDFDKKTDELENQFDRDENALLRQRKEKMKQLEADMDAALAQKKQELDKEHRTETDKLQSRHDARLREMKEEFAGDERKLTEKIEVTLGEKTEAAAAITKLKMEVERLTTAIGDLERSLNESRLETERVLGEKRMLEEKYEEADRAAVELQRQLREAIAAANASSTAAANAGQIEDAMSTRPCDKCEVSAREAADWRKQMEDAQRDRAVCQSEIEQLKKELSTLTRDLTSRTETAERENATVREQQSQIEQLKAEVSSLTRDLEARTEETEQEHTAASESRAQELSALKATEANLRAELGRLQSQVKAQQAELDHQRDISGKQHSTNSSEVPSSRAATESLQRQYDNANETIGSLKNELADLQDQLAVLATTNSQIKEQLLKESNEKKHLREQLNDKEAELLRTLEVARNEALGQQSQQVHQHTELQRQLDMVCCREKELEGTCSGLRTQAQTLESEKRAAINEAEQLMNEKRRLEAEKTAISAQLQAVRDAQSSGAADADAEAAAAASRQVELLRELDSLHVSLRGVTAEKDHLTERVAQLSSDIETLQVQNQRLELGGDNERSRSTRLETEKNGFVQRLKDLEEELDSQTQKMRTLVTENAELKTHLSKSKLKEQGSIEKLQQAVEENSELEVKVQGLQRDLESLTKEMRTKTNELENKASQNRELCSDKEVLEDQISDLKSTVSELKTRLQGAAAIGAATAAAGAQATEVALLREQSRELESKVDAMAREKAQLGEKVRTLTQKVQDADAAARNSCMEKDQAMSELQIASAEVSKWKAKADKAVKEVDSLSATARELASDKDELESMVRRLTDQANELTQARSLLDKSKRALEAENATLRAGLEEAESSQRSSGIESQAQHGKVKRLESELSTVTKQLQTLQETKASLETDLARQGAETTSLQTKIRLLKAENADYVARVKEAETDSSRNGDAIKQLELLLSNSQSQCKRECEDKETLRKQLQSVTSARDELESAVASWRRKAEATEGKWKEHESTFSRDDLVAKRKLQQLELERDGLVKSNERLESQLKASEKEVSTQKDEVLRLKSESESLQARLKNVLKEHEEVQAMLLTANLVNATGNSNVGGGTYLAGTSGVPADAMLVKLQLADVNRNELEVHLADVSSQLEVANRRCSLLESRCRDQSMEIESLHVETASLRSASHKMHLSALETLSLVERLEYEHKKRILKADFSNQLRDFQEREEGAMTRHKARLRSQYERQIDELVAELEKLKRQRVDQEEAAARHVIEQIRRQRDAKREELQAQNRKELQEFEQELLDRKSHEFEVISKAVEQEEEELAMRLREARQAIREEQLVEQTNQQRHANDDGVMPTAASKMTDSAYLSNAQDPSSTTAMRLAGSKTRVIRSDINRSKPKRSSSSHLHRLHKNRDQTSKEYRNWKQRIRKEQTVLAQAKTFITRQRQELAENARRLKKSTSEWERSSRGMGHERDNQVLHQMKEMLDESAINWNQRKAQVREKEEWIKRRERKLVKMKQAVARLRPGLTFDRQRRHGSPSSNNSLSDEDGSEHGGSGGFSDSSSQSEGVLDALSQLKQFDAELLSDTSDFSGDLMAPPVDSWDYRPMKTGGESFAPERLHVPSSASYDWSVPVGNHYPIAPFSTGMALQKRTPFTSFSSRVQSMDSLPSYASGTNRWLFSRRPLLPERRGVQRLQEHHLSQPRLSDRSGIYQRQISKWARDRERVHDAATRHSSWLSGLYDEVKEYSASRQDSSGNDVLASAMDGEAFE